MEFLLENSMWITLVLGLFIAYYLYLSYKFSYFRRRGIAEDPGYFPFGSKGFWELIMGKTSFIESTRHVYNQYRDEKFVGSYMQFGMPVLIIRDIELAKKVMIKDFDHFVDRRPFVLSKKSNKYFVEMLTMLTGEKWKRIRSIMSPVFTSGKLKNMMDPIHKVGDELVMYLMTKTGETNVKQLMTSFTVDVIANVGLGIESNSFKDPDSPLRKHASRLLGENSSNIGRLVKMIIIVTFPTLSKMLDLSFIDPKSSEFIASVIRTSLELRKKGNIRKNDFIDTILDVMKEGTKTDHDGEQGSDEEDLFHQDAKMVNAKSVAPKMFTQDEIELVLISNAMLMFFAGFETVSNGMSLCIYFLARNPEVQERVYQEIQDAIENNNGQPNLSYNTINSLSYLEQVVQETLRMYPLLLLERLCVKDYKIEDSDFVIPKGMVVQISNPQIMKDEKYYKNPEQFDPDRFSKDKKNDLNPYAYMAFGHGPRNCIGMRFALMELKVAIMRVVASFKLSSSPKTVEKLIPDQFSPSLMPKGGIWVNIEKR